MTLDSLLSTGKFIETLRSLDTSLRSRSAESTLDLMGPYRDLLQIHDLIEHTIPSIPSIPIFEAVRSSSPSGFFCLGKGFSSQASMASALMEAAEMSLVEYPRVNSGLPLADLPDDAAVVRPSWCEPEHKSECSQRLEPHMLMLQGYSLATGHPLFVPEIDVFYRPGWITSEHGPSTNGLASGNTRNEALVHSLCELLERDAMRRWMVRSLLFPPQLFPLDPDPLWDANLLLRIDEIHAAGFHVVFTRLPCAHPVTVMEAQLLRPTADGLVSCFTGWGCHPNPLIAIKRALAESVQVLAIHLAIRDGRLPASRFPGQSNEQRAMAKATGDESLYQRRLNTASLGSIPRLWSLRSGALSVLPKASEPLNEHELVTMLTSQNLGSAFTVQVSPPNWPIVALRTVAPALQTPPGL